MFRCLTKITFFSGVVIGILLAVLLKLQTIKTTNKDNIPNILFNEHNYEKWFKQTHLRRREIPFDSLRYSNQSYLTEANFLYKSVQILCIVLVKTTKNVKAAKDTWGQHCNKFETIQIANEQKKIQIPRPKQNSSWSLLCNKLKQVPEDFHWVVIVYDYTFVLLENLRWFVGGLNHKDSYYLGYAVKFWSTVYNMGQAGYVLSKGAIDSFKNKYSDSNYCTNSFTYRNREDFYIGKHLAMLNITPIDTRDKKGFSIFHPYNLHHVSHSGENDYKFGVFPHQCCSPNTITFQAIEGDKMYTYYYLLYTVQLFKSGHFGNKAPLKLFADDYVWKNFLKERNVSENITPEQYYKIWENLVDEPTSFAQHMKREEYFDYQ